jgi:hypothetical protein
MSIDYVALARLDRRVGLLGLVSFVSEIEFTKDVLPKGGSLLY